MQVIVIGAGVIGASVAYRLALGRAAVTVLERGRVGGGTSGSSFAWTNANNKPPLAYHALNVAGMRAHAALRDELGATPWWHDGGSIEWERESDRAAQAAKVERLRGWGYAAEWLTLAELRALEPDIDPAAIGDAPIAFYPEEGWLDPVPYAHAMLALARRHGARLLTGRVVERIVSRAGRVTGVRLADGTEHPAERVVNCAGRWAGEPDSDPVPRLPLAPTAGLLVFTPPVATSLRRVLRTPGCDLRPDGAGRLVLIDEASGATTASLDDPGPASEAARALTRRAAELLPCVGAVEPEATRLGIRPIPRDGFSAVGWMPGVSGHYAAVTHSGVTLSALLGRLVAEEVLHDAERPELADFRPARLLN